MLLTLAVASLWAGPLLNALAESVSGRWKRAGGMFIGMLVVLVVLTLLPHSLEDGGWISLLAFLAAAAVPALFEVLNRIGPKRSHVIVTTLVVLGLIVHGLFDGAAIGVGSRDENHLLGWAVIIHRVPVGLALWIVARRTWGLPATLAALAAISLATIAGAILGSAVTGELDQTAVAWFEAAVAGALVHALVHRFPSNRRDYAAS